MKIDFDWALLQKANEEKTRIEQEIKKYFFEKKEGYFSQMKTDIEVTPTEIIIKTNYNSYKFRRKQNGSFFLKKDKLEQYFYAIDASYTIRTWQEGLNAAKEDFEQILNISEEFCAYLKENSKLTFSDNIKRFYNSMFGKKDEMASIELKEDLNVIHEDKQNAKGNLNKSNELHEQSEQNKPNIEEKE